MLFKEILEISAVALGSLGGGAAIIFGFSNFLGKVWANRLMTKEKAEYARELESLRNRLVKETESYKLKLKKSELIFEKELEAASRFVALRRSFMPTYSHPGKDWCEACDEIAQNFENIAEELNAYLAEFGAVLQKKAQSLINSCETKASVNQFEADGANVSIEANRAADELYTKLQDAERALLEQVHSQSTT